MQLNKAFSLSAILGAKTSAAQHEKHRILSLQLGELSVLPRVVRKLIVGKYRSRNKVRSHRNSQKLDAGGRAASPCFVNRRSSAASACVPRFALSMGRTHKASDQRGNLIRGNILLEMTRIKDMHFSLWHAFAMSFRLSRIEREVILSPDNQQARLLSTCASIASSLVPVASAPLRIRAPR
jgi:hypothetical protein